MLFNLTENAIRYNRQNECVRASVSEQDGQIFVRVRDNGSGIPEQYKESIFQPFFRVDKSRSREYGGVGLGLSLVWEIASLHGGRVFAEESSENGTVMLVTLPKGKNKRGFTTRMCEAGVNVKVIQDALGHKDVSTTLNIYTDVTKELRKSEFEGLEQHFNL